MGLELSHRRREEVLAALRRGTVPANSLDVLAVGLDRFEEALMAELKAVSSGRCLFKALRGEYGSGKTFFARWLTERAQRQRFVTAEVQISESQTPLHRLETIYRRLIEGLSDGNHHRGGALRAIVDGWFYALEEEVMARGTGDAPETEEELLVQTNELMDQRLASVSKQAPAFAACLRTYREAIAAGKQDVADGLLAWLSGLPNVAASIKRHAGIKGDIDHFGAMSFLRGLLVVIRDSGLAGLVLVLDEVETLQRVRRDVRDKGLNALRQLMDEIDAGRFPGLHLVMTGTPAFYDGPNGVQRLPPLAQRLHVDFKTNVRFDNPRAVQIRLQAFNLDRLVEVGVKVRDLYASRSDDAERIRTIVDLDYIEILARAVTGDLGGKVGVAPRVFLKKLVSDVLDRVDQFPEFDPRVHYQLTVTDNELTESERAAKDARSVDDIELKL